MTSVITEGHSVASGSTAPSQDSQINSMVYILSKDKDNESATTEAATLKTYAQAAEFVYTEDMAIVMDAIDDVKYTEYISILKQHIDPKKMRVGSRIAGKRVVVFCDSVNAAKHLWNNVKSITVRDHIIQIRPLRANNKRVVISNVNPTISNAVLLDVLNKMGIQPVSSIVSLKIGIDDPDLAHMICYRRQVYIKADDEEKLKATVSIQTPLSTFHIYFSTGKLTCFKCHEEGHMAKHCRQLLGNSTEGNINTQSTAEKPMDSQSQILSQDKFLDSSSPTIDQTAVSDNDISATANNSNSDLKSPATILNLKRRPESSIGSLSSSSMIKGTVTFPNAISSKRRKRKKKTATSVNKSSLEEIKAHVTEAVSRLPSDLIQVDIDIISQFLFDTYCKSDIEEIIKSLNCDRRNLDTALRHIRNLVPNNLLARIRRLRNKISSQPTSPADSMVEGGSSGDEMSQSSAAD